MKNVSIKLRFLKLKSVNTAYKNDFRNSAELQSVSRKINENAIDHNLLIKQETLKKEQEEIQETILKVTEQLHNSPQPNQADLQKYLQAREQLKKAHAERDEQLLKYLNSTFVIIGALIGFGVAEFCIAQFLKQPTHYLDMSTTWKHWVTQKAIFFIVLLMVSQCVNAAFKFQQNFPQASVAHAAEQIVKAAIRYGETNSANALFEQINNPVGMFGDVPLRAFDLEGNVFAYRTRQEFVGQNLIDKKTPDGKYLMQDMIEVAKSSEGQGWYSYSYLNKGVILKKQSYVASFTDRATGKKYVVIGGYHPHRPIVQIILSSIASYVAQIRLNNYFYIEIVPFTREEHVLTCVGQYVLPSLCSVLVT